MDPTHLRKRKAPERIIQDDLVVFLRSREWHVMETHGNMFQCGFPDLYAFHKKYGARWIEVKNPLKYQFTSAQLEHFPKMGSVWILIAANESEYKKLWLPPNWWTYIK